MMKQIVVMGSTGSIGKQALQVIEAFPAQFKVLALCANNNAEELAVQAARVRPRFVGLADESAAAALRGRLPAGAELLAGQGANEALAALPEADIVLIGIAGFAGLPALLAALRAGKTVALANKESIVCGHTPVQEALAAYGGRILPVDSEHSAIFQCLQNGGHGEVAALHITASGGPFWKTPQEELASVSAAEALKHPVWRMGSKISIDSATLVNKGLEVIEASYLFRIPQSHIEVLIHPQSIVHSMVEYCDGAVIAQLSAPDMRLAIQYALGYPARLERQIKRLSLPALGMLEFHSGEAYPAIRLARAAAQAGGAQPTAYCVADEVAVGAFLEGRIGFMDILHTLEYAMGHIGALPVDTAARVNDAADTARELAEAYIAKKE